MYRTLEEMMISAAEAIRPSERLTVSEVATRHRRINNPGSYIGPWNHDIAPYLVEIMDTLTSEDFRSLIFVGPARCGKSDTFMNWMASSAIYDPADMMVVHMTQATARDWSISDLGKVFRHSPDIGARLKPGKQNDNVFDKLFVGDTRLMIKWPTITELSGKTVPRCWIMDYDRMDDDVDGEGSPFDLTAKRTQTFGRFGMTVAESSPGRIVENANWIPKTPHEAPPTTGILALYNRGDRRRFYWRCDDCRLAFEPSFKLLDWPTSSDPLESAEMAVMRCPHCNHPHHHDQNPHGSSKRELNIAGRWIKDGQLWRPDGTIEGQGVRSETASFWLKGVCAAFASWKDLVLKHLAAMKEYDDTGAEEALKTTVNVDQGEPYTPKARESDRLPETLKARAKDLGQRVVPVGTRFLIATIDVQSGARARFVVQVHGVGEGGDVYIVDRFEIEKSERLDADGERARLDPGAYLEDWNLLKKAVIQKTYPLGDRSGRHMAIRLVGCDSGGSEGVTANAYNFWRALRNDTETVGLHRRFILLKGTSRPDAPRVRLDYPDSGRKDRNAGARGEVPVLFLNSNMLKDQLDKMLDRTDAHGGQIYFPLWLPDKWYVELTVEVKTAKGWENLAKKRNESWDLLYYCLGLLVHTHIGVEHIDWTDPPEWAREWDDGNSLIFDPVVETRKFEAVSKPRPSLADLAAKLA